MKKIFLLIIYLTTLSSLSLFSQEITDLYWIYEKNRSQIRISFNVYKVEEYKVCEITPYFKVDGRSIKMNSNFLYGDTQTINTEGRKTIYWDIFEQLCFNDFIDFGKKNYEVILNARFYKKPIPKQLYASYNISGSSYYGLTIGYISRWGFYARAKSNGIYKSSNLIFENDYVTNYPGTGYYIIDDKVQRSRFAITAGVNHRIMKNLYVGFGAGYGFRNLLWHYNDYEYEHNNITGNAFVLDKSKSADGVELEFELGYIIKDFLFVNLGVNFITGIDIHKKTFTNSYFIEPNLSIGYIFNNDKINIRNIF